MLGFEEPPTIFPVLSPKFQLKEYGVVPLEAVAVKLTPVPTVPDDGPLMATVKTCGDTVRDWVTVLVLGVGKTESLTVRFTV